MARGFLPFQIMDQRRDRKAAQRQAFQASLQKDREAAITTATEFMKLAEQAAETGNATPEQLEQFGLGAVQALQRHAATLDQNRQIAMQLLQEGGRRNRRRAQELALRMSQLETGEQFLQKELAMLDARFQTALSKIPNPQAEGQRAGQQQLAQAEAVAGRPLSEQERTSLAGVEAGATGGPFAGEGMRAQAANTVISLANKFRRGEKLTPEEQDTYAIAWRELNAPRMVGSASTGFEFVETQPDPRFPRPEEIGAAPAPGATPPPPREDAQVIPARRSPEQAGRVAMMQSGIENARRVRDAIVRPDGSVDRATAMSMKFNLPFGEGRTLRAQFEDAISSKLRLETGATATPAEIQNIIDRFEPKIFDSDETIADKSNRLVAFFEDSLRNTDPDLFERLTKRGTGGEMPAPPEGEAEAVFQRFDESGNPVFKRPDGSMFMVVP